MSNAISEERLCDISGARILLQVDTEGEKLVDWAKKNSKPINLLLQRNGAVLIRGLRFIGSKQFGQTLTELFGEELLQYSYRSTPRTELRGNVYTATEYHADQTIPQHNENAYSNEWAMRIGFLCMLSATKGGATPISDSRLVYQQIPTEIRNEFEAKGVMYVRNYSDIDLPWSEVFQTTSKVDVEAYCDAHSLKYDWLEDNRLRTQQVNAASQIHPVTREKVWFNQAHLFHISNLESDVASNLIDVLGEEGLPRNAYFGDGTSIDLDVLRIIREIYEAQKVAFEWNKNDLLLLDNMLYTHGREPYEGQRKVLVGMACPRTAPAFESRSGL